MLFAYPLLGLPRTHKYNNPKFQESASQNLVGLYGGGCLDKLCYRRTHTGTHTMHAR